MVQSLGSHSKRGQTHSVCSTGPFAGLSEVVSARMVLSAPRCCRDAACHTLALVASKPVGFLTGTGGDFAVSKGHLSHFFPSHTCDPTDCHIPLFP